MGESLMDEKYRKLKTLLMELFQLDQPDLDFGLYRVLHGRSAEITQFLDNDLLPQVKASFAQYKPADKAAIEKELSQLIAGIEAAGMNPEDSPKVKELRTRLADEAVDLEALEADVYDHLYSFFRRYYSEGDFLSKRVYKAGVYAIPYEGEEVKLHWANADQYYIKTSEYLRDYAFRLRPDDEGNPMRVHFRLVDVAEGEHGNVKEQAGKERRFKMASESPVAIENDELVVRFTYQPDAAKQKDLNALAERIILANEDPSLTEWLRRLGASHQRADGSTSDLTRLRLHLDRYTARNTFDYFIHKDLGGFLRRELDFYIKNEVMHLDDVESESAPRVEQYLSKIKVIRRIAEKIIEFLAQLEDFQKKLWRKKKFVVETSYCIRLNTIPREFYTEIVTAEKQWQEWRGLLGIPRTTTDALSMEFLEAHPSLLVNTRNLELSLTERLIAATAAAKVDGVLFNSENFQALMFMQAAYQRRFECVYIDPPYNTGDSEIPYKNTYLHASWLTLMENRLRVLSSLLGDDPAVFVAIDDFEMVNLSQLIDSELPSYRREIIIVNHHPQGGKARTLAHTHEYMLACVPDSSDRTFIGRAVDAGVERRPFKRSGTAESNFRVGRPNSFYAILTDPVSGRVVGVESPPRGPNYPIGPTVNGENRIYPVGGDGVERVWRRSYESAATLVEQGKLECSDTGTIYQIIEADERTAALFSNWIGPRYNAGMYGANLLRDILGEQNSFSYPKSIYTVEDAIFAMGAEEDIHVLDFFGGSGTTAHSVINLNREDGGHRRFVLVEQGEHFEKVLLPRLKKIAYTPEWKGGRPSRPPTLEEVERAPVMIKVLRLESYEDALNNLDLHRTEQQQATLDLASAKGTDNLTEQYMLRYLLDVETRGSQSLLNVSAFMDPTAYKLKVKRPGSDESRGVNVDLLETFNWLIGLTVDHIAAPRTINASFKRDDDPDLPADSPRRLLIDGDLTEAANAPWWFRTVTGTTPDGRKTLIIWRKRPGGDSAEGVEQDNLVLNEWFSKQGYLTTDHDFDLVYVNGGNNLEMLKSSTDKWTARIIEDDFHRLMFESDEG
jgi:adenine-specific DNA-methyltransferase